MHKITNVLIFKIKLEFLTIFGVLELFWQFAQKWRVMGVFWIQIRVLVESQIQTTFFCACLIFHFFLFYDAEMRRNLWPKKDLPKGCLRPDVKKCSGLLDTYTFLEKSNKKNYNRAKVIRTAMLLYIFFRFSIVYLPKKKNTETEKWLKATESPLSYVRIFNLQRTGIFPLKSTCLFTYKSSIYWIYILRRVCGWPTILALDPSSKGYI